MFVCASVVFCEFCVDMVKEMVGFGMCWGCLWAIVGAVCARSGWLVCLFWLPFVISGWTWSKTWLVLVCAWVVFCDLGGGFGQRHGWCLCLLWLSFVMSGYILPKTLLVLGCVFVIFF